MVKQILNKIMAILIIMALTMGNLMIIATESYATFEELEEQKKVSSNKNVSFDTYFYVEENSVHSVTLNTQDEAYVNFEITVGEGYLKDTNIALKGANFEIISIESQNIEEIVNTVEADKITLNPINSKTTALITAKIKINHRAIVEADYLGRETQVEFTSNYTNIKGKTESINSNIQIRVDWTSQVQTIIDIDALKYMQINNKSIIQAKITSGINGNVLPIKSTNIKAISPQINGINPEEVRVTAIKTEATNGIQNGDNFTKENYTYNKETGITEINTINPINSENKISWKNGTDEYLITYIYEGNQSISNIELKAISNICTYNDIQTQNEISKSQQIQLNGQNVDFNMEVTDELSKGYIYANSQYETEYKTILSAQVAYVDSTDILTFEQNTDKFIKDNGKTENVNSYYKQTKINKQNLEKILGIEGQVQIYSGENLIGTINKDTQLDESGNYIFNYGTQISNIRIQTTKPVEEGKIIIENTKAITQTSPYTFEQTKTFKAIENNVIGYSKDQEKQEIKINTNLTETTSKAEIQIGKENLSTVVTNEDVEIRAILETDDITDDLYKNPNIRIELPEEIENISIKSANILFNDEMQMTKLNIESKRIINVTLTGDQTTYVTDNNKGITIIFNTDITLKKTASNKQAQVTMTYTNEKAIAMENGGITSTSVNIVAPTGIIALNSVTNEKTGEVATSIENNQEQLTLERNSESIETTHTQTIINNNEETINGMNVLGRIANTEDNLGSTINTILTTPVQINNNINYQVYYSENAQATDNLEDEDNQWQDQMNENTKSYLIQVAEEIPQGEEIQFTYNAQIPQNLEYGAVAKSAYTVAYNTLAEKQQETATPVAVTTGSGPILEATLEDNTVNGTVYVDKVVTYTVTVTNKGTEDANNVTINIPVPDGMVYVEKNDNIYDVENDYIFKEELKNINFDIGNIAPNQTINKEFLLYVKEKDKNVNLQANISGENIEDMNSNTINITTKENKLNMELKTEKKDVILNETYVYSLILNSKDLINDLKVNLNLPDGLEYVSSSADSYVTEQDMSNIIEYSEKEKSINIEIDNLENDEITININVKPTKVMNSVKLYATAIFGDYTQTSNLVEINVKEIKTTVDVSSNIKDGSYIKVGENINYIINIKNENDTQISSVSTIIYLPNEIEFKRIKVNDIDITESKDYLHSIDDNSISIVKDIDKNANLKIEIETYVDSDSYLTEDKDISTKITINKLQYNKQFSYKIEKNIDDSDDDDDDGDPDDPDTPDNPDDPNDPTKPDDPSKPKTYKISGTAWLDSDKDGKMSTTETKLSGITVRAIDNSGNILYTTKTNEKGEYTLENLTLGQYTVIFEYDSNKYLLTTYEAEGVQESENSNVVKGTYNGKTVATTNNIKITDRSITNINIGLIEGTNFDLSLSKKVTKISMANTKTTKSTNYNTSLAKIDLDYKYINNTKVAIEYEITVTNEGDIPGTATKIVDYLPEGFDFSTELNKEWYTSGKNIETKVLSNETINPGESKTVTLVLTKNMTENDNGIYYNTAEIAEHYNEFGQNDSDSTPGNNKESEDDQSSANVILGLKTGGPITYISLTMSIMALICIGAYEINKRILKV